MRLIPVVIAVTAALLCAHHASAFSMDSSGGAASDGSSGYTDPDEMLGGKDDAEHGLGYDPSSHHTKQPAQEIINGQGVLIPASIFPTSPSRR